MKAELSLPMPASIQDSRIGASRDALVVATLTLTAFFAASVFDLQERISGLTRPLERFQADELVLTLLTLALALAWFAWRRWRQATEQLGLRLAAERALMNTLAENRGLSQKYLLAQEEERRSIARELHDELGQCLNAIKVDATAIRDYPDAPPRTVQESAQAIIDVSSRLYDVTRGLMGRLRPVALDEFGLADALRHLVSEWRRRNPNVTCTLDVKGDVDGLEEQLNITLYRVVQEGLTNVTRHARATAVQIGLERARDELQVWVHDDGVGISRDVERVGLGIAGLRERVEALDGRLEIVDSRPHGVEVRAHIPVALRIVA